MTSRLASLPPACRSFLSAHGTIVLMFIGSSVIVWLGVAFGNDVIRMSGKGTSAPGVIHSMSNWDGNHYSKIVDEGYQYDRSRASNVAFFPGFPLLSWCIRKLTGLATTTVLPLVSLACLLFGLFVLRFYLQEGAGESSATTDSWPLVVLCLWPTGLFLRMGYSEALFLLLTLLAMLGLRRGWPGWQVALIIGTATGVRSVGVALLLPLVWQWWCESKSPALFVRKGIVLGPLACWGLFAYVIFLNYKFNDPLVFAKTQQFWASRPQLSGVRNLFNLATLEPIWSVFMPGTPAYWKRQTLVSNPLFSFRFFNPVYFVACAGLIAFGAWKKWLTTSEWLLSAGLLGIPYFMQAHRMVMLGHGRFTCVVFPMYIVLGRLLSSAPPFVQAFVVALMGIQLFQWTAMFSSWHPVY